MPDFEMVLSGDPAPHFRQRCAGNPSFNLDTCAGPYLVLCFFGTAAHGPGLAAWDAVLAHRHLFDDVKASLFGVSIDPSDEGQRRVADCLPGIRVFWDFDRTASKLYGAVAKDCDAGSGRAQLRQFWVVIDPTMRIMKVIPFSADNSNVDALLSYLQCLPPPERFAGFELQAPVLVLPNVFEVGLCEKLISYYEERGGEESGFMHEVDGKTVTAYDHRHKQRRDCLLNDPDVVRAIQQRVQRRIVPEIVKVHQFKVTRMERYIISCYSADDGGHFQPHRDNTTMGTAHRRFAVSVNLNAEFEGGELNFPEYGPRTFKPAPGAAVVFSCSLLHAVTKVTKGRRYVFLPFLYDDEAAKVREANNVHLGGGVGTYKS
jgi:peroxiredoxin/predicted 2-oxoglutarate/Fe(II)-dependent dioxygenase YbiX